MHAGRRPPGVRLEPDAWREIRAATLAAFPRESCGTLGGTVVSKGPFAGDFLVRSARAMSNESVYDRRFHFLISAERVREESARIRGVGGCLLGFFHSHPDGGRGPSEEDVARAWPGELQFVASFGADREVQLHAFAVGGEDGRPRALSFEPPEGRTSSRPEGVDPMQGGVACRA